MLSSAIAIFAAGPDFSGITTALGDLGTSFLAAAPAIILGAVGVGAVLWGAPKLFSLFKRTAK